MSLASVPHNGFCQRENKLVTIISLQRITSAKTRATPKRRQLHIPPNVSKHLKMSALIYNAYYILVFGVYIYTAFISRTMNKNRFRPRIIMAAVTFIIGIILELSSKTNLSPGTIVLFGSLPIFYLIVYEITRRLMRPLIGEFPFAPHWDKVRSKVSNKGYPKNRVVTSYDQLFGFIMFFTPILIFVILTIVIDK